MRIAKYREEICEHVKHVGVFFVKGAKKKVKVDTLKRREPINAHGAVVTKTKWHFNQFCMLTSITQRCSGRRGRELC